MHSFSITKVLVISSVLLTGNNVFAQTAKDIALDMKVEGIEFVHLSQKKMI